MIETGSDSIFCSANRTHDVSEVFAPVAFALDQPNSDRNQARFHNLSSLKYHLEQQRGGEPHLSEGEIIEKKLIASIPLRRYQNCPDTGLVAGGSWMGSGTGWSRGPAEWRRMTEYGIRNMGITSVWSV